MLVIGLNSNPTRDVFIGESWNEFAAIVVESHQPLLDYLLDSNRDATFALRYELVECGNAYR